MPILKKDLVARLGNTMQLTRFPYENYIVSIRSFRMDTNSEDWVFYGLEVQLPLWLMRVLAADR